ncbi:MAG: EamA family transporter [Chlamydiia bacterium]|nr:EamA family transporter [Chlamydiia bacterium]
MYLVVILYALFASIFTLAKACLEHCQPFFLVGSRMLVGGALLLLYCALSKPGSVTLRGQGRGYWTKIVLLGVFAIYCTNAFEFWGLQYLTSFKTCFIYSLSPFFSALLSYLMFAERLGFKKWLGLAVGFIGFIPILSSQGGTAETAGQMFVLSWPEIAVISAAAATVYGWILLRDLVKFHNESPILANGWSMLIGGAISLLHSFAVEDWNPVPVSDFWIYAELALAMILISNVICYNLYGHLLRTYTATFLSFAGFMTPLFTAVYGIIFLGEQLSTAFIASTCIVFVGLLIFYFEELREGVAVEEAVSKREEAVA